MKKYFLFFVFSFALLSCTSSDDNITTTTVDKDFKWIIPTDDISGSLNPFPLAKDPLMIQVKDIDFIADNSRVAILRMENEIRIYPYQFISKYEAVNEKINDIEYAMTYCPNTKSGLVIDRNFKNDNFTIRASGYLFQDNQVLIDENSDTFWSQILIKCVKGKYANERVNTFNFVETRWTIVKKFFPEALVFTNTSINNKIPNSNLKKDVVVKGDLIYGILDLKLNQKNETAYLFNFSDFNESIQLKSERISNEDIIIIGSNENQFITSYINDSQVNFTVIENQFPIVMEDNNNNKWDVFGIAVSGPRKGDQLKSLPSFFALGWAWENFYDYVIYNDSSNF